MVAPAEPVAVTPWAAGHLGGRVPVRGVAPRLLFGRMVEDPAIELDLFPPGGRVVCVASAGDTARALAATGRHVVAVDLNAAQLDEVRRRLDGAPPRRGSAERLLAVGRAALVPLGWRRDRLARFCLLRDPAEQREAWERLASPALRAAVAAALRPALLRFAYGAAFTEVVEPGFGGELLDRVGRRIGLRPNRSNPWLAHLLIGTWPAPDPPPGDMELVHGDVADVLEATPPASLDGISLSNVLDGPSPAIAGRLLEAARRAARPGAPIVLRTLRTSTGEAARRLADRDRSLIWGGIEVHRGGATRAG